MSLSRWLHYPKVNPKANLTLVCFPYAGGNSSTYFHWQSLLSEEVELALIQPPGRASRIFEPAIDEHEVYLDQIYLALSEKIDKPFAIFGHSMGSRIGFELAKRLSTHTFPLVHLFASASRAAHLNLTHSLMHQLPDNEFIESIKRLGAASSELLDNAELLELYLPTLRADFKIAETYIADAGSFLDVPITVLNGSLDTIEWESLLAWKELTKRTMNIETLPGGHLFIDNQAAAITKIINQQLVTSSLNHLNYEH